MGAAPGAALVQNAGGEMGEAARQRNVDAAERVASREFAREERQAQRAGEAVAFHEWVGQLGATFEGLRNAGLLGPSTLHLHGTREGLERLRRAALEAAERYSDGAVIENWQGEHLLVHRLPGRQWRGRSGNLSASKDGLLQLVDAIDYALAPGRGRCTLHGPESAAVNGCSVLVIEVTSPPAPAEPHQEIRAVAHRPISPLRGLSHVVEPGMMVLLTGQATASQNGVHRVQESEWTRPIANLRIEESGPAPRAARSKPSKVTPAPGQVWRLLPKSAHLTVLGERREVQGCQNPGDVWFRVPHGSVNMTWYIERGAECVGLALPDGRLMLVGEAWEQVTNNGRRIRFECVGVVMAEAGRPLALHADISYEPSGAHGLLRVEDIGPIFKVRKIDAPPADPRAQGQGLDAEAERMGLRRGPSETDEALRSRLLARTDLREAEARHHAADPSSFAGVFLSEYRPITTTFEEALRRTEELKLLADINPLYASGQKLRDLADALGVPPPSERRSPCCGASEGERCAESCPRLAEAREKATHMCPRCSNLESFPRSTVSPLCLVCYAPMHLTPAEAKRRALAIEALVSFFNVIASAASLRPAAGDEEDCGDRGLGICAGKRCTRPKGHGGDEHVEHRFGLPDARWPRDVRAERRREIDRVVAEDARRFPAFALARRAAVADAWEGLPASDIRAGYTAEHVLAACHRYEALRGGLETPSREAMNFSVYYGETIVAYERARGL
jgi:hypothetical protein